MCRSWAVAGVLALLLSATVDATVVAPLSFEQLVNESSAVVYGRVLGVRAQWTDDRRFIESVISVEVIKGLKGGGGRTLQFTVPGGQVGRYLNVIPGSPVFAPGDLAVLFLSGRGARLPVTTGLMQGVYRVQPDVRSGELVVVPPSIETGTILRGDAKRKPAPLAAFEASVRAVTR